MNACPPACIDAGFSYVAEEEGCSRWWWWCGTTAWLFPSSSSSSASPSVVSCRGLKRRDSAHISQVFCSVFLKIFFNLCVCLHWCARLKCVFGGMISWFVLSFGWCLVVGMASCFGYANMCNIMVKTLEVESQFIQLWHVSYSSTRMLLFIYFPPIVTSYISD